MVFFFLGINPGEIPSPWKEHPREGIDGSPGPLNFKNIHGPNGMLNPFELIRWDNLNNLSSLPEEFLEDFAEKLNPLYGHGVCKWPGCESDCDDFQAFNK